jgi:uncharacterized membrane protein YebE (DUF533 family)
MFDAKTLLEQLVKGADQPTGPQTQGGGLADILAQLIQEGQGARAGAGEKGGSLDDILRNLLPSNAPADQSSGGQGGGLTDILGKLQQQVGQADGEGTASLRDILGQILSQATQGVKEGAGRISEATGARDALTKATGGQSPEELIAKLMDLIANNQFAAGAAASALGGLLLGTSTGRGVIGSAAKLGALALIGGLAYKAVQNYQAGKPLLTGASALAEAAPRGSGFEPEAQTNESATLLIRTMIAAAAADGRIDEGEKTRIIGSFDQAGGFNADAQAFVQRELSSPATAAEIANAVTSKREAVQVYTAARLAIEVNSNAEQAFLANLADRLGIDQTLAAHIDATAKSAGA